MLANTMALYNWIKILGLVVFCLLVFAHVYNSRSLFQEFGSSFISHPKHSRSFSRTTFTHFQRDDEECHIDKIKFPCRSVIVQSVPPYKMLLHPSGSDTFISDTLFNGKGVTYFEKDIQMAMDSLIPKDVPPEKIVILDIGANIGLHAMYFASKGYEVHAFEPFSTNFYLLQCSKTANAFKNLHLNNFGLSNRTYTACMGVNPTNQGHAFVKMQNDCNQQDSIQLRTLDNYFQQNLRGKEIFLAKIDVEGHELTTWLGAQIFLSLNPPKYVFSEVSTKPTHELGQTTQQYFELMEKYGYIAYHMRKHYTIQTNKYPPELEAPDHLFDVKFTHKSVKKQ